MMFGDQCKVTLGKGHVLGIYLRAGCNSRRSCVHTTHKWTYVETAAITLAAGTVLKGMQEH